MHCRHTSKEIESCQSLQAGQVLPNHPSNSKAEQLQAHYKEQDVQHLSFVHALTCIHDKKIALW